MTSPALSRFTARLSPSCAVDLNRFVAAYGEDVVLNALSMDKSEAQTRNAIMRCWARNGMSAYAIAKLLGTDPAGVKRGLRSKPKPRKEIRRVEALRVLAEREVLVARPCAPALRLRCKYAPPCRAPKDRKRPVRADVIRAALEQTRAANRIGGAK